MDRSLEKAPLGLLCAWLQTPCSTKAEHDRLKKELSGSASRSVRMAAREAFVAMARIKKGTYEEILAEETKLAGSAEPDAVKL